MEINVIAALAKNNAIGLNNKLLYWLPNDLKRFKELTTGNTIIMGRKTFESLPKGALPNRCNVVLTRQSNITFPGTERYPSLEDAIFEHQKDKIFIIGGESVYKSAMNIATKLYITWIDDTPQNADAFFPNIGDEWELVNMEHHVKDEKHAYNYTFADYKRRKK